jgi:hypothetical protein
MSLGPPLDRIAGELREETSWIRATRLPKQNLSALHGKRSNPPASIVLGANKRRPVTIEALDRLRSICVPTRHSNQKKGDSWEAKDPFKLLDEFEKAVRRPPPEELAGGRIAG